MASLDARLDPSQWATQPSATWLEDLHPEVFPATYRRLGEDTRETIRRSILAAMRGFHASVVPGFERFAADVAPAGDADLDRAHAYLEAADLGIAALAHLLRELAGVELVGDGLGPELPSAEELAHGRTRPEDRERAS